MARYHGINADTFKEMILDSGAVYYNYTDLNNPGTLLGATKGGIKFTRKPTYTDLKYEGVVGKVKGSRYLTGVEVTITANIVTFAKDSVLRAIPNSVEDANVITETEWDANAAHNLSNVVIIATKKGAAGPVIIEIDNPLCDSDFTIDLKDKSEATTRWTFSAFYDPSSLDTPPWRITMPDIERTVIVGSNNYVAVSDDIGETWDVFQVPISGGAIIGTLTRVTYNKVRGLYVCSVTGGYVGTSPNAYDWDFKKVTTPDGDKTWNTVTVTPSGRTILGGLNGWTIYSDNCVDWTPINVGGNVTINDIKASPVDGTVIANGSGAHISTNNAASWTSMAGNIQNASGLTCSSTGRFVSMHYFQTPNVSAYTDGSPTWTVPTQTLTDNKYDPVSVDENDNFITIGSSVNVATSSDGINWTETAVFDGSTRWWELFITSGGRFIAVGDQGKIAVTDNPLNTWTEIVLDPLGATWFGVTTNK